MQLDRSIHFFRVLLFVLYILFYSLWKKVDFSTLYGKKSTFLAYRIKKHHSKWTLLKLCCFFLISHMTLKVHLSLYNININCIKFIKNINNFQWQFFLSTLKYNIGHKNPGLLVLHNSRNTAQAITGWHGNGLSIGWRYTSREWSLDNGYAPCPWERKEVFP